jgi:DNA-binding YbaB/EbfC family protein
MLNPKMLKKMQDKLAKTQEKLADETVEISIGGGAITVVANGQQKILSVKLAPEVVDPDDVEMLEDLIVAAVNDAQDKAQEVASKRLGAITGGLNIPGL